MDRGAHRRSPVRVYQATQVYHLLDYLRRPHRLGVFLLTCKYHIQEVSQHQYRGLLVQVRASPVNCGYIMRILFIFRTVLRNWLAAWVIEGSRKRKKLFKMYGKGQNHMRNPRPSTYLVLKSRLVLFNSLATPPLGSSEDLPFCPHFSTQSRY